MNKKQFLLIIAFWLILIGGLALYKQYPLSTGEEVLLRTEPVDPRDLFRGDYVILNYEISSLDKNLIKGSNVSRGDDVYVTLEKEDGYGVPTGIHTENPEGLAIKGKVRDGNSRRVQIEYGIEDYFVPEGKGGQIEELRGRLDVRIKVDRFGNAAIDALMVNGTEFEFEQE